MGPELAPGKNNNFEEGKQRQEVDVLLPEVVVLLQAVIADL